MTPPGVSPEMITPAIVQPHPESRGPPQAPQKTNLLLNGGGMLLTLGVYGWGGKETLALRIGTMTLR